MAGEKSVYEKTIKSADDLADRKLFMTPDGSAGFAITKDGDLTNMFTNGTQKWLSPSMLTLAVQQGAKKAAVPANHLLPVFTEAGFKPVAYDAKADKIYMVYDPKFNGKFAKTKLPQVKSDKGGAQQQARAMKK
jgi:hypothetical protein